MEGFEETDITGWRDPQTGTVYTWVIDYDTHYPTLRPLDHRGMTWWKRNNDVKAAMRRNLSLDKLFIDIGAHHGEYSLIAAHLGAVVLAFEPDKTSFGILEMNTRSMSTTITPRNVALGDRDEIRQFSSMPNSACSGFKRTQPRVAPVEQYDVQYLSVLHACPVYPALIKIDTEGFEMNVLEGIQEAGYRCPLIVEPHGLPNQQGHSVEELVAWGKEHDYLVSNISAHGTPTPEVNYENQNKQLLFTPLEGTACPPKRPQSDHSAESPATPEESS